MLVTGMQNWPCCKGAQRQIHASSLLQWLGRTEMVSVGFILDTEVEEMKQAIMNFLREEEGLTTVEYAIAGGLVGLAVVAAFQQLGATVGGTINQIEACIGPNGC